MSASAQKLAANEAAILAHLDAVRSRRPDQGRHERAEADGTYSARRFGIAL